MSAIDRTKRDRPKNPAFASLIRKSSIVHRQSSLSGFTLLELLAAIAILGVIVVMMSQIFSESDRAWNSGTGRAVNNTEGRAAMNMIIRDLELAVSDNILTFKMGPSRTPATAGGTTYGFNNSEINFVSLQNDSSDTNRTAREIQYWVEADVNRAGRYQLVRSEVSDALTGVNYMDHCYHNPSWYNPRPGTFSRAIVAENVVGLAFHAPDGSTTYESGAGAAFANTPQYVDVYLEIMNEREAKQLYDLKQRFGEASMNCIGFVERNARRHVGRVYFQNWQGYLNR